MVATRFRALAATTVAALALVSACSSDGSGSDAAAEGQLDLAAFASLNGVPAFATDDTGVFAEHGIKVKISTAKTSTEMVPQLLGGKVDLALVDTATSLVAAGRGVDLVYIAGATNGGIPKGQEDFSFANVWVKKDSPVKSLADLTGKTVGVPQIKSQPWVDLRGSVDAAGGDSASIEFVESPDTLAALKSGQVDATTTSEPIGSVERAKGDLRPLGPVNSGGGGIAYVWIATRAFADANPELVKSFAEAVREGNAAVNDDHALLVKTAARVLNADPALLEKAAFPVYAEKPLTAADLEFSIKYLGKYDLFEKTAPDAEKLVRP
ncbi:hypothetical protein GCM10022221_68970 [Actinocorallia aurea]